MNQPLYNLSPEAIEGHKGGVIADKYSSDYHLLNLLFGPYLSKKLKSYPVLQAILDVNSLNVTSDSRGTAYIIICDLKRFTIEDLTRFIEKINHKKIPIFTITPNNLQLLFTNGLEGITTQHLLELTVPDSTIKFAGDSENGLKVDLHSSELHLDPSLLMRYSPVPVERPCLEQNTHWISGGKPLSLTQRLRYPLGVTKRHAKNCFNDLRAYARSRKVRPAGSIASTQEANGSRLHFAEFRGTIFLAIFEKFEYASDWSQLVTAFCLALKDKKDATLVLWVTSEVADQNKADLHHILCTVAPFDCSVTMIQGELSLQDLHTLLNATAFLLNVEMYRSLRLDAVVAAAYSIPVISAPNSLLEVINQELIYRSLDVDEQPAPPDKSASHQYSAQHLKVNWLNLSEQILCAYQLGHNIQGYEDAKAWQFDKYQRFVGRRLTSLNT